MDEDEEEDEELSDVGGRPNGVGEVGRVLVDAHARGLGSGVFCSVLAPTSTSSSSLPPDGCLPTSPRSGVWHPSVIFTPLLLPLPLLLPPPKVRSSLLLLPSLLLLRHERDRGMLTKGRHGLLGCGVGCRQQMMNDLDLDEKRVYVSSIIHSGN
jgi:hypothetical protein